MKKNLMSVVILALVLANLILTAVLTISILPQTKQANELITKVCAAIDLDLEGGSGEASIATVPMDKIETYTLAAGETMTINLTKGEDGVEHYALVTLTLGINMEHEDYKTYGSAEELGKKDSLLQGEVTSIIASHTVDEMRENQKQVQDEILKRLREMYGSDFVISVSFTATYS